MADLTGKTLANGYPNLVTIGATTNDNPTSGTLENGKGNKLTSVTFDGAVVVNESGGNNDFRVEGDTNANLLFVDASTDRVGIGTDSPGADLTVTDGTSAGTLSIGNDSASTSVRYLQFGETNDYSIQSNANSYLRFHAEGAERMRIDSSGNVGIGETNPSAKLEIKGTDTEPLTVLNDTVYTFAANVATSQSNTHTVTIPFTSQGSQNSIFMIEIYASKSYAAASTVYAGRALYALRTLTSISNITELEDNGQNLSFAATSSGMDFIVTITTTAPNGQEPNRIGVMAKVIRGNGTVGNEPTSMTIA